METKWYLSAWARWGSAILLPPVGLALLWLKPGGGFFRKLVGTLMIAAIGAAQAAYWFDLHIDLDGSGMRPMLRVGTPERNYAKLEADRAEQTAVAPPPLVDVADVMSLAAAQDKKPAKDQHVVEERPSADREVKAVAPSSGLYWTDYRGQNRDGIYAQAPILTLWPKQGLERVWKQPVGGGWASFVVANGIAYTIEQRRAKEAVTAYDMRNGRELWAHTYDADFQESMGGPGPRATPTYHQGFIYSMGATGELRMLDAKTGKLKWGKNILSDNDAQNLTWAQSAAPLIVDDKVIVQPGGKGKSIVAYNKITGARVWSSLSDQQAYTSPMLLKLAGVRQIVTVTAARMVGLKPEDGSLLWEYPWTTEYDVNAAQPIILDSTHVFVSAGYGHGAALVELTKTEDKISAHGVWNNTKMKNKFSSSVLYDGYIYGFDEAILACMDAKTGQLKWKGGRYGYGQLLLADGHLIVLSESGDVVLVKATPESHLELAKFAAISGKTWNVPAIDNGMLLVRNTTEMACFRIGK